MKRLNWTIKNHLSQEESVDDWQSFSRLSDWRLSFTGPGRRLQETYCPWHLIHHRAGEKYEMTGPSDVEGVGVGETSAIWFGRRRSTIRGPVFSVCKMLPHSEWRVPVLRQRKWSACCQNWAGEERGCLCLFWGICRNIESLEKNQYARSELIIW